MTSAFDREPRNCAQCDYDLHGLRDTRCPECGLRFDPDAPPPPRVPWIPRRKIGRVRAYYRTVWLVIADPERFAEQAWRATPAHEDEAESFRRVTVALAAASVALMVGFGVALEFANTTQAIREGVATFGWSVLASLVFFWFVTLPTPLDEPRTVAGLRALQVEPLRRFCCAGLGLMPFFALPFVATAVYDRAAHDIHTDARQLIVAIGIIVVAAAWWRGSVMYLLHSGRIGWNAFTMTARAIVWFAGALVAAMFTAALTAPFFRLFAY